MNTGDTDAAEVPRPRARWWADAAAAAVLALALASMVAARRPPAPAGAPALVVIGLDGISWPIAAPALARGWAPNLARLTGGQRGRVIGTGGMPLGGLWDWVVTSRPPLPGERGAAAVAPRPMLWELVAREGRTAAVVSWPGFGGARRVPPAPEELHVVVDLPPHRFPRELLERLGRDRGSAAAAVRAVEQWRPDLLVIGFAGAYDPARSGTAAMKAPPAREWWGFFDEALGKVLDAAGPGTRVVAIGRGLGEYGTPAAEGLWLAAGPGLAPGVLRGPVRTTEIAPTMLALAGLPLVAGAASEPSPFVMAALPQHGAWRWREAR